MTGIKVLRYSFSSVLDLYFLLNTLHIIYIVYFIISVLYTLFRHLKGRANFDLLFGQSEFQNDCLLVRLHKIFR